MVVGDEALPKSFVEAGHRLGDQDGAKPEQFHGLLLLDEEMLWYFWTG